MIYKYLRTMRRKSNLKQEDISKKCNNSRVLSTCLRNINTREELNSENIDREEI